MQNMKYIDRNGEGKKIVMAARYSFKEPLIITINPALREAATGPKSLSRSLNRTPAIIRAPNPRLRPPGAR